jgi:putative DNA methylase
MPAMDKYCRRLIEVDLPIRRISEHARREKSIRLGHISTLHIWWARRPLAACRAVILAALWPDPADPACPPPFQAEARSQMRTWAAQHLELASGDSMGRFVAIQKNPEYLSDDENLRTALLDFIADFSNWDNSSIPAYLETSRRLTQMAHDTLDGASGSKPLLVDTFAGGGAIPLEGLRVGCESFGSDLNPIPVLLNKVQLEYAPRWGRGLSERVRESGLAVRAHLKDELSGLYTASASEGLPHAFFWARTVLCEGPTCGYRFPLLRSLWLKQTGTPRVALRLQPRQDRKEVSAEVLEKPPADFVGSGTSRQGAATCPVCGYATPVESVRSQLKARAGGTSDAQLLAVAVTGSRRMGKQYRLPTEDERSRLQQAQKTYLEMAADKDGGVSALPNEELNHLRGFFNVVLYGMTRWGDLFAPRQALLLIGLVRHINNEYERLSKQGDPMAEAIVTCLALVAGKVAQYNSACCRWKPSGETLVDMFGRQALPMVWDYAEAYPFNTSTGDYGQYLEAFCATLDNLASFQSQVGVAQQDSATRHSLPDDIADLFVIDPPYYSAIPYADLSDFFYVWLKRSLGSVHRDLFESALSPKDDECVALSHRAAMYRNKTPKWFETQMGAAFAEGRRITKPRGIGVVVFANKETAGWEAMLEGLVAAGWVVTGSWPIDTEMTSRLRAQNSAVLGSSIHLVCRPRENLDGSLQTRDVGDWRDVLAELPVRVHEWMPRLADEGIVGADAIFACLGPALEVFSRYSSVEKASGENVALGEYLEEVWAAVSREALSMIFKDADASGFDEDARLTAMWLWTLHTSATGRELVDEDSESKSLRGYGLEYDAARKIAQGLGAHLESLSHLVELKGDTATLLSAGARTKYLFGKDGAEQPTSARKTKQEQMTLNFDREIEELSDGGRDWVDNRFASPGHTILDQLHQSMILFGASRGEALRRFLVDDGVGRNAHFWRLAQALSALYPPGTDEKRWVDGVLGRKKGLGL